MTVNVTTGKKRNIVNWLFLIAVSGIVLFIDQFTKTWVVNNMAMYESRQPIPALGEFFQVTRSFNTGAAFGIFSNAGDFFLVIAVVIITAMLYFYPRLPQGAWLSRLAMGLIVGGALGNALDRLQYGYVVDFIHYRIPNVFSNVSNLADHAILLGVFVVLLDSWLTERQTPHQRPQESDLQPPSGVTLEGQPAGDQPAEDHEQINV